MKKKNLTLLIILVSMLSLIAMTLAFQRNWFEYNAFGNAPMPGGGIGDMHIFHIKNPPHPVIIRYRLNKNEPVVIARFLKSKEEWVWLSFKAGKHKKTFRLYQRPNLKEISFNIPININGGGDKGSWFGVTQSEIGSDFHTFLKKSFHYNTEGGALIEDHYAFDIGFEAKK